MGSVKTAISIPQPLFEQAEHLSREMHISRSQLYAKAVEDFIRRYESDAILAKLNEVYADGGSVGEKALGPRARARHRKLLEGQW